MADWFDDFELTIDYVMEELLSGLKSDDDDKIGRVLQEGEQAFSSMRRRRLVWSSSASSEQEGR